MSAAADFARVGFALRDVPTVWRPPQHLLAGEEDEDEDERDDDWHDDDDDRRDADDDWHDGDGFDADHDFRLGQWRRRAIAQPGAHGLRRDGCATRWGGGERMSRASGAIVATGPSRRAPRGPLPSGEHRGPGEAESSRPARLHFPGGRRLTVTPSISPELQVPTF
jgi:hypothetical protein